MAETQSSTPKQCGFVAIVGRPNVGKSTLINQLIQEKLCITADRPQTTRHAILAIQNTATAQIIYIDTPGIHNSHQRAINRYLNKTARNALYDAQVIVFMAAGTRWLETDDYALKQLASAQESVKIPVILVLNKIDLIADRTSLLPHLQTLQGYYPWTEIIPLSAQKGDNVDRLQTSLLRYLPAGEPIFPQDQFTNRSERFLTSELIREQLTRYLGQELPYAVTVEIEAFQRKPTVLVIDAVIWVERPSQKAIVIGKQGQMLKQLGQHARHSLERQFQEKIYLNLWVKVKSDWSDNETTLQQLGYRETFE